MRDEELILVWGLFEIAGTWRWIGGWEGRKYGYQGMKRYMRQNSIIHSYLLLCEQKYIILPY